MDDTVGMSSKKQRVCSQRQVHLTSRLGSAEVPWERPLAEEETRVRAGQDSHDALCSQDPLGAGTLREVRSQCAAPNPLPLPPHGWLTWRIREA